MFELTFLGTAAAVPAADRGLPAVLWAAGGFRLLVDCGEGTQRQLMRARLGFRGLESVLLTHAHLDHLGGLPGLVATRELFGLHRPIEVVGSGETIEFVRRYLAITVGPEDSRYRLRKIAPGPVLSRTDWRVSAFPVLHRGTESLGYLFESSPAQPLSAKRLSELGVPEGPARKRLARGEAVTLGNGQRIVPDMVRAAEKPGARLAIVGDTEETETILPHVRGADALVIEATFLARDAALARARGHLTAAEAGALARDAGIRELMLTHISGRAAPAEIAAEAAQLFPATRVVADLDRAIIGKRSREPARPRPTAAA